LIEDQQNIVHGVLEQVEVGFELTQAPWLKFF
jgi:hypothetical protein